MRKATALLPALAGGDGFPDFTYRDTTPAERFYRELDKLGDEADVCVYSLAAATEPFGTASCSP